METDQMMATCYGRVAAAAESERQAARRQAILDAAESLFLEHGFAGVSLQAIVRRSGGSLATVYELFGNKHGLLRAVVDRHRERGLGDIEEIACSASRPADILLTVAERYHGFAADPRSVDFLRLVIGESLRDPDFGQAFHRDMHDCHLHGVAECFERWNAEGKAEIDDPLAAAELYFSTVMCDAPMRAMLGAPPEPTDRAKLAWRLQPFIDRFRIA